MRSTAGKGSGWAFLPVPLDTPRAGDCGIQVMLGRRGLRRARPPPTLRPPLTQGRSALFVAQRRLCTAAAAMLPESGSCDTRTGAEESPRASPLHVTGRRRRKPGGVFPDSSVT